MPEIGLYFNQKNFEYDVYHLVKAFFPDKETVILSADSEGRDVSMAKMTVIETPDSFSFTIESIPAASSEPGKEALVRSEPGNESIASAENITRFITVPEDADRKAKKNALKRIVYQALSEYTGRKLPWGNLTGIRPVRIPLDLLEKGWKNAEIAKYMRETCFTGQKKTALAIAIANREKDILDRLDPENGYSLYVGIPFCPTICLYCSFGSHPLEKYQSMIRPYMEALYKELLYISEAMADKKLTSIYVGGGTPTSLDADTLGDLLNFITTHFSFSDLVEFTVEAGRPDTITEDKLYVMLASGVDRISVNPQTMNQKTLDLIGRRHTVEQTIEAFETARNIGFGNINMDLIAGLPGEGPDEVRETLRQIEKLAPDSLTIHSLALKRSSRMNLFKDEYAPLSFYNTEEIMDSVAKTAVGLGMHPYYMYRQKNIAGNLENVGYAKDGCFGIYNILIMEEKQTIIAAGAGAITKLVCEGNRIERVADVKDVTNYIERIDEMIERKRAALSFSL